MIVIVLLLLTSISYEQPHDWIYTGIFAYGTIAHGMLTRTRDWAEPITEHCERVMKSLHVFSGVNGSLLIS